jgi:hypothetical protein
VWIYTTTNELVNLVTGAKIFARRGDEQNKHGTSYTKFTILAAFTPGGEAYLGTFDSQDEAHSKIDALAVLLEAKHLAEL